MSAAYQSFIDGKWRDIDRETIPAAAQELCDPLTVERVVVVTRDERTVEHTAYRRKKNQ